MRGLPPKIDLDDVSAEIMYQPDLEQWGNYIKATRSPIPAPDPAPCPMFKLIGETFDPDKEQHIREFDPDHCEKVHDAILMLPEILQRVLFAYYCEYPSLRQAYKQMPCRTLQKRRTKKQVAQNYNRLSQREFTRHLNYAQGYINGVFSITKGRFD